MNNRQIVDWCAMREILFEPPQSNNFQRGADIIEIESSGGVPSPRCLLRLPGIEPESPSEPIIEHKSPVESLRPFSQCQMQSCKLAQCGNFSYQTANWSRSSFSSSIFSSTSKQGNDNSFFFCSCCRFNQRYYYYYYWPRNMVFCASLKSITTKKSPTVSSRWKCLPFSFCDFLVDLLQSPVPSIHTHTLFPCVIGVWICLAGVISPIFKRFLYQAASSES